MPGRKKGHAASVSWKTAISIAGSQDRLTEGVKYRTWKGWEETGKVPAYRVTPFLLARLEKGDLAPVPAELPQPLRNLLDLLHPDAAFEPLALLPKGYMDRYQERVREAEKHLEETARRLGRELIELRERLVLEHEAGKKGRRP